MKSKRAWLEISVHVVGLIYYIIALVHLFK